MRWYFAPPGAKPLPGGSIWASTVWLDLRELCDTAVGEQPRTRADKWTNGAAPLGVTGKKFCGKTADFHTVKTWDPKAPKLQVGPDGLPICCNPILAGAIAWCGSFKRPNLVLASRQIGYGALEVTAPPTATGSLVLVGTDSPATGAVVLTGFAPDFPIAVVLTTSDTSSGALGLGVQPQSGGNVVVAAIAPAVDDLALTAAAIATGEVELSAARIAAGSLVLSAATIAAGDVGLVDVDPASGLLVLADVQPPPPWATGSVVLAAAATSVAAVVLTGKTASMASGSLVLFGSTPAAGNVVLAVGSPTALMLTTPAPATGAIGLTAANPAPLALTAETPASGLVGLVASVAGGLAEGHVILAGDVPAFGDLVVTAEVIPPPPWTPDGSVILGGMTQADGSLVIASPEVPGPPYSAPGNLVLTGPEPPAVVEGNIVLSSGDASEGSVGLTWQPSPDCTTDCDQCPDGTSKKWSLTIAGITNGSCSNCNGFNGTFTLVWSSACIWISDDDTPGCAPIVSGPAWYMDFNGGTWRVINIGAGDHEAEYHLDAASWNCHGSNTLTFQPDPTLTCDNFPATVTVTPISDC